MHGPLPNARIVRISPLRALVGAAMVMVVAVVVIALILVALPLAILAAALLIAVQLVRVALRRGGGGGATVGPDVGGRQNVRVLRTGDGQPAR